MTLLKLLLIISLSSATTLAQENEVNTIIKRQESQSSREVFTKDTNDNKIPGYDRRTTEEQDSAYAKALRLKIPIEMRLRYDLMDIGYNLISLDPDADKTGLDYLPKDAYSPDPNMIVQREVNLMRAFEVPYARTYNPYGVKVSLSSIGRFLGLTEDYSGVIQFRVDSYTQVEIVIYSIQAVVVATLFKGYLPPGTYERTWTGRDQNGRMLAPGDYVGEVRIKGERSIRKRIVLK